MNDWDRLAQQPGEFRRRMEPLGETLRAIEAMQQRFSLPRNLAALQNDEAIRAAAGVSRLSETFSGLYEALSGASALRIDPFLSASVAERIRGAIDVRSLPDFAALAESAARWSTNPAWASISFDYSALRHAGPIGRRVGADTIDGERLLGATHTFANATAENQNAIDEPTQVEAALQVHIVRTISDPEAPAFTLAEQARRRLTRFFAL